LHGSIIGIESQGTEKSGVTRKKLDASKPVVTAAKSESKMDALQKKNGLRD
jgi:hypothetical protein